MTPQAQLVSPMELSLGVHTDRSKDAPMQFTPILGSAAWSERSKANLDDVEVGDRLPRRLIERFVLMAMRSATVKRLRGGLWVAEIPGFAGVWADGSTADDAVEGLADVLLGWLELKIEDHDGDIPSVAGINLNWL